MKRTITLLLALLMLFPICACGTNPETPAEEPVAAEEPAEKVEETPQAAEWSEESWLPLVKDGEKKTLTVGIGQMPKVQDYDTNKLTQYIEEKTGIDIEFVYFSTDIAEAQQQLSLMASAGQKMPDVMYGFLSWKNTFFINQFGEDGYLANIADYLGDNTPYFQQQLAQMDEDVQKQILSNITDPSNDEIYCLPYVADTKVWDNMQSISYINKTWLDNLGLEMPKTTEDLYNVLTAFVNNDPNGNGKADEIGMLGESTDNADMMQYVINAFVYYDNAYPINATDGKVWSPYSCNEYREALKFINKLYKEGLVSSQNFTGVEFSELIALDSLEDGTSLLGFTNGHPANIFQADNESLFNYVPVDTLADATGKGGYMVVRPVEIRFPAVVSADCEDVELAVKFLDFFYRDETVASLRHGIIGENWDWEAPIDTVDRYTNNIKILDDGQAFFDGVTTWNRNSNSIQNNRNYLATGVTDNPWQQKLYDLEHEYEARMLTAPQPAEIVGKLVYTADEVESVAETTTLLAQYARQARAEFATGVSDPNNDADWQAYLDKLETIGLSSFLQIAQAAYDRAIG